MRLLQAPMAGPAPLPSLAADSSGVITVREGQSTQPRPRETNLPCMTTPPAEPPASDPSGWRSSDHPGGWPVPGQEGQYPPPPPGGYQYGGQQYGGQQYGGPPQPGGYGDPYSESGDQAGYPLAYPGGQYADPAAPFGYDPLGRPYS